MGNGSSSTARGVAPDAADSLPQAAAALLPHEVLVRILRLLPAGERVVTPGRVSHAWAAAKAQACVGLRLPGTFEAGLPPWYLLETYPGGDARARFPIRYTAIRFGMVDVVAELYAHDAEAFVTSPGPCSTAALRGELPMLIWLHNHGCPMDRGTCDYAATIGHLGALRFARANGAPWGKSTPWSAARGGHLETLQFCVAEGCPIDAAACVKQATERGHAACRDWLLERFPAAAAAALAPPAAGGQ